MDMDGTWNDKNGMILMEWFDMGEPIVMGISQKMDGS